MTKATIIIDEPGKHRATECWVFLAVHDNGSETIVAEHTGNGWLPLVTVQKDSVQNMREIAQLVARTGKKVKLVKFTAREDLETLG